MEGPKAGKQEEGSAPGKVLGRRGRADFAEALPRAAPVLNARGAEVTLAEPSHQALPNNK